MYVFYLNFFPHHTLIKKCFLSVIWPKHKIQFKYIKATREEKKQKQAFNGKLQIYAH